MTFFTRENFWVVGGQMLKAFDGAESEFELFPYPPGTPDGEWIPLAGKRTPKPFILSPDDGMLNNAVSRKMLRESLCHFIYFGRGWSKTDWPTIAWKLVKYWPAIVEAARSVDRQSVIGVSLSGKIFVETL